MPSNNRADSSLISILFVLTAVILLIAGGIMYVLYQGEKAGEVKELMIPRGSSIGQVSHLLVENNIISHPTLFKALLRVTRGEQKVRAGEFRFHSRMSAMDALKVLYYDEPIVHQVTIPEGYSIKQIAEILEKAKLVDRKSFIEKTMSPAYAQKYKLYSPNLEGYLYPDTYVFSRVDGEEKIIERMVQTFFQKTGPDFKEQCRKIGMTIESVTTLASIIEKETAVAEEREIVASVFHNRLKKGMKLQSDPTTIYSIADYKGNITKADLLRYHPYNTYTIPGLPPGPIASPGIQAIRAALRPANTEFLFFVAKAEGGSHVFSKTYGQHSRYVKDTQVAPNRAKHLGKVTKGHGKTK